MAQKKLGPKERRSQLQLDPVYRRKLFERLLQHLAAGYSLDCFPELSEQTIGQLLKDYPSEWCEEELSDTLRHGKLYWEGVGRRQSEGTCLGNSRSWYYNMANRYGWRDKLDLNAEHKGQVEVSIVNYASTKTSTPDQEA